MLGEKCHGNFAQHSHRRRISHGSVLVCALWFVVKRLLPCFPKLWVELLALWRDCRVKPELQRHVPKLLVGRLEGGAQKGNERLWKLLHKPGGTKLRKEQAEGLGEHARQVCLERGGLQPQTQGL